MNKFGKRFIALLVVFTSIISFLPLKFMGNEQIANAAEVTVNQVKVAADGNNITQVNNVYTTESVVKENFTVTVDNKSIESSKIQPGKTEIIKQEVIITAIDGINLSGTKEEKTAQLQDIGTKITTEGTEKLSNGIGVTIVDLPLGVNKVKYQIKETTQYRTPIITNSDGTQSGGVLETPIENMYPSRTESEEITIQYAKQYVQSKVQSLNFDSYVGGSKSDYNDNNDNKTPFLFTSQAESDENMPLSYTFDVPDGTETLNYRMVFSGINITNAIILKNGQRDSGSSGSGNTVSGSLTALGQRDIITMKITPDPNAENPEDRLIKTYSIEIKYNYLNADNDFTLRNPGITKLNYNEATDVKAFVGKRFEQSNDEKDQAVLTYKGQITIDKRAEMINISPILGRRSEGTAFIVTNHYYNNGSEIANSKQINGKQYVDFNKGTDNEIWIDIYKGKDGNTEGGILARYKLKVNLVDTSPESQKISFSFGDAYLTQPGRKDEKIDFNLDRRTYDLYSNDTVNVSLDTPQTSKNEYFKAWIGNNIDNDDVIEVPNPDKKNTLPIDVSKAKKIMLQAYYDEIIYKKDEYGNNTSEIERKEPHPLGLKYVFYVAKNADKPDGGDNTNSRNASLSGLKFNNGTLKDIDGTSGFLSNKYKYNVTVPKVDTETKITAIAEDSNAKSIIVTVVGTSYEYELTSGEPFEIHLNSNGVTDIQIVVTAADGVTKKTYNVTIKNDERSSSAKLKTVFTNVGDFDFDPDKETTKIRVDQDETSIKVTPVPEDSKARVTVDGKSFDGTPIAVSLRGSQETDIDIKVTSEDGSTSERYTLEVYRTNSDLDDGDDDDDDDDDIFYDEFDKCWVDTSKYEEWGKVDGKLVYFNNRGRQVKNSWISTDGKLYYLGSKGYKETGWRTESDGKSYYLDTSTGELKKGWIYQHNNWYYLGLNGVMQKGWLYLNNKWYYFTPSGQLVANQSMYIDGKVYNFAQDGAMY